MLIYKSMFEERVGHLLMYKSMFEERAGHLLMYKSMYNVILSPRLPSIPY